MTTDPHLILHQLFSPAFPVGAFAWSHGLETAIQDGQVQDAASARDWVAAVLEYGSGWSDAVICARAATDGDPGALSDLATALCPSSQRRAETLEQGQAFARTVSEVWGLSVPPAPYPVAVGLAIKALGLPVEDAIGLFLQAFSSNLTSAAVRLVPLGQTEGQRITRDLAPLCQALARRALAEDLDDIGGFAPMLDIQSQRHETLYSRVFRS
ncbi:urease accessory protein UreF [Tropicibacter oceani]|uniref:Urease accessory protein UreF n=1 Tax=Tropicibacter oceani TaxID=3058420 RepID=A0ABY8QIB7_9RHOB|nr:urease accessory protein UreF [Tropicibacter oceani]WGW03537.1 urease accessory protein UreF [Tropicibacter oceani]